MMNILNNKAVNDNPFQILELLYSEYTLNGNVRRKIEASKFLLIAKEPTLDNFINRFLLLT